MVAPPVQSPWSVDIGCNAGHRGGTTGQGLEPLGLVRGPVVKAAIQRGSPAFQIGDCRRPCPCGCHMHQGAWGKRMVGEDIQCLSWSQMSTGSVTDKRTKCLPDFITPNLIAPDELTEDGDMRVACVALMSSQAAKVQLPAAIETGQDFGAYD